MKYKLKPVEIDAVRWDGEKLDEVPDWIKEGLDKSPGQQGCIFRTGNDVHLFMDSETVMVAEPGDYIIFANGFIYPCKPDQFDAMYEKVDTILLANDGKLILK